MLSKEHGSQRRGGMGKSGGKLREDDALSIVLTAMSHDHLVFIANDGSCFSLRVYDVPKRSRTAQGTPLGELLPKLKAGVGISTIVPIREHSEGRSLVLLSKQGKIKRLRLDRLPCVTSPARIFPPGFPSHRWSFQSSQLFFACNCASCNWFSQW
jgi:DNA gyrase subunit A